DALRFGDTEGTQANAAFALYRLAAAGARMDEALPALRTALTHRNPAVRVQAAAALGEVRDSSSLPDLVAMLQDGRALAAAAAANALGRIGDPTSVAPLVDALSAKEIAVRREARGALTRIAGGTDLGSEPGPWKVWQRRMEVSGAPAPASGPATR
ncbi:MAG TPA: HEAT repeat domain-containing protein, partial [Planctomycetota bacterium]|nr:HEAT repeat domain-containing protein [Planctomycetota bacterium]